MLLRRPTVKLAGQRNEHYGIMGHKKNPLSNGFDLKCSKLISQLYQTRELFDNGTDETMGKK